ncbi:MAG: cupredoxin domain-containing protein [bacterium]|nr:cupredoxin domain-containing protein [bacterium]
MRINTQQGIAPILAIIIALLVVGGGAYGVKKVSDGKKEKKVKEEQVAKEEKQKEEKEKEERSKPTTLQIKLLELGASGQGGQAVIVATGTSTVRIIVNLAGKPSGVSQPAHIHLGSCPTPGAVKYPLTSVDKGASQTDIPNLTIEQLLSELPLAINVHKSATDLKNYIACGDITAVKDNEGGDDKEVNATMPVPGSSVPEMVVSGESKKEAKVNYTSTGFAPKTITVKKGETVVFENKTGKSASVASNDHPTHLIYPEFDQYKTDQRGKNEFKFTFTKVGSWSYHDHLNSNMTGTVIVE